MVLDPNRPMSDLDWRILGHEHVKNDRKTLPSLRLHVPFPATKDGLHALVAKLNSLANGIHERATLPYPTQSAIGDSMGLVRLTEQELRRLRSAWEHELNQDRESVKENSEPNVTKLRLR